MPDTRTDEELWERTVVLRDAIADARAAGNADHALMGELAEIEAERTDRRAASYLAPEMIAARRANRAAAREAGHLLEAEEHPDAEMARLTEKHARATADAENWRRIAAEAKAKAKT